MLPTLETTGKRSTFVILVWIIKSLIIRGHRYGFELLDSVIKQCGSLELGRDAADSFITLLHQDELILNKSSHAIVSVSVWCASDVCFVSMPTSHPLICRSCLNKECLRTALES